MPALSFVQQGQGFEWPATYIHYQEKNKQKYISYNASRVITPSLLYRKKYTSYAFLNPTLASRYLGRTYAYVA